MSRWKRKDFGMNKDFEYKGYIGSIDFSVEDKIFYGKVLGIRALISYEGKNGEELIEDFHKAVDDYLDLCKERGTEPEKPYKGTFNVRISPDLHRDAVICASNQKTTLNNLVERAIKEYINA